MTPAAVPAHIRSVGRVHHVADRAHGTEVFRRDLHAGLASQPVQQVHGVDAVDFQVFVQPGRERDPTRIELEQFRQRRLDLRENFVLRLHSTPLHLDPGGMNRAFRAACRARKAFQFPRVPL